jgi:hypothetical protein
MAVATLLWGYQLYRFSLSLITVVCLGAFANPASFGQQSSFKKADAKPYPCQTEWTAPPLNEQTPNIVSTSLAGGYTMYTVRVHLHTPEGNQTECAVRQFRFNFPALQNWMSLSGSEPTVQITIESPFSQGVGDTLLLYAVQRISCENENGYSAFVMDAATPNGYQSPFDYYANVTVIGKPEQSACRLKK